MRKIVFIALAITANFTYSQPNLNLQSPENKGFSIGIGIGAGALSLTTNDTNQVSFSTTLPNLKIGYRFNQKLALFALLPGANYKYQEKARGFEAIIFAGQYWIKNNWWILAGTGLTFDAPAFYTVKDPKTAEFYTGFPAITVASGYEIWQKGRFALDLQYRFFFGKSNLQNNGTRQGLSNMLIVGFNWY